MDLGEIGVFVRVVDKRSFRRAGETLGLTASGVSRAIGRLESRLGVRLLERTTRSIGLTVDGAAYYERCARILRDLEDANSSLLSARGAPRGRLKVDAPSVVGRFVLAPALPKFLAKYPELSIELSLRDHVIDPIAEGIDVVLRMANLRESELVQKKMGTMSLLIVGSPRYFASRGRPRTVDDLKKHELFGFLAGGVPLPWSLRDRSLAPGGRLHTNCVDTLRSAALAGEGLALLFEQHVKDDLAKKRLESVMTDHERSSRIIHALYTRDKAKQPKVQVFLDFVSKTLRA